MTAYKPCTYRVSAKAAIVASRGLPQPGVEIGYFTGEQLKTLPIEPHLEKFRQRIIDFVH
ncbi:MAG TPA: hypothetical protein VMY99_02435 [Nevskiaceae bacterium]|nr:hypothetical protein [Nevskiaceae bacterium]